MMEIVRDCTSHELKRGSGLSWQRHCSGASSARIAPPLRHLPHTSQQSHVRGAAAGSSAAATGAETDADADADADSSGAAAAAAAAAAAVASSTASSSAAAAGRQYSCLHLHARPLWHLPCGKGG